MSIATISHGLVTPALLPPARMKTVTISPPRVPSRKLEPPRSSSSLCCQCGVVPWPGSVYQDKSGRRVDGCVAGTEVQNIIPMVLHTVGALTKALHLHDSETAGHVRRVTHLACLLGQQLGLPRTDLLTLQVGAMLHDIGKLAIPDTILRKAGPLCPAEMKQIHQHPLRGEQLLRGCLPARDVLEIVRHHHERWDGAGYPDGVFGERIPYLARIVAIVDVYDALTADRPYRRGMSPRVASDLLAQGAGTQFDPTVLNAFFRLPNMLRT